MLLLSKTGNCMRYRNIQGQCDLYISYSCHPSFSMYICMFVCVCVCVCGCVRVCLLNKQGTVTILHKNLHTHTHMKRHTHTNYMNTQQKFLNDAVCAGLVCIYLHTSFWGVCMCFFRSQPELIKFSRYYEGLTPGTRQLFGRTAPVQTMDLVPRHRHCATKWTVLVTGSPGREGGNREAEENKREVGKRGGREGRMEKERESDEMRKREIWGKTMENRERERDRKITTDRHTDRQIYGLMDTYR